MKLHLATVRKRHPVRRWSVAGFLAAVVLPIVAISAGHASAERVNFAKYQKVTASSHSSTYRADFATDGVVSNFHSFRTGADGPHWLEISWPRHVTLASAHLYLGLDNIFDNDEALLNFKLQYHDGSGWLDVPGAAVTSNTETEVNLIFAEAITADRFRLWSDDSGSRIIRQVAMFPPNLVESVEQGYPIGTDVQVSVTHMRPAEATTIFGTAFTKRAVDGYVHDTSRWVSNLASEQSIEVNLLAPHVIGSAHLYTGLGETLAQADFKLQSWNGASWVDIPGTTFTGNTSNALVIPFSSNVTTSRVRLVNTTNSNSYTRVKELVVFPPRDGGYPLGQDVKFEEPPTATWAEFEDNSYELRSGIVDERLLGYHDGGVRFSTGSQPRHALGWQLLLNHRDGSYRVRHLATGKCLALAGISSDENNPVILEDYTGMPHQDWFLQKTDATQFRIINLHSGLALQAGEGDAMVVAPVDPDSDLQLWRTQNTIQPFKKGIAASMSFFPNSSDTWIESSWHLFNGATTSSWSYTWGRQTADTFPFMTDDHTFHPMQWSGNMNHGVSVGPLEYLQRELNSSPKPVNVMGFNEPEHATQGNVFVDDAIALWPRLEALGMPLVAPAPASAFGGWLADFSNKANARGLRRDYTAVHWYGGPNAQNLINHLQQNFNTFGRPVWLTEFGVISWTGSGSWTITDNYNFLAEFIWRAESLPWLKKYSLFQFEVGRQSGTDGPNAPRGNSRNSDGSLTALGELYAGWDGVIDVLPGKIYHVHNRSTYRRLQNPATDATATSINPDLPNAGTQWFLTPGTTANTHRLVSRRDGRLLRFTDGGVVDLVPSNNTTGETEWRLAANQHGWYFLEHPQTNKRLRANGNGTFTMGAITSTADDFKWRFVVPAVVESAPQYPDPDLDSDGDDLSDLLEFAFGTDPDVPNGNPFKIVNVEPGTVHIEFPWNWSATGLHWQLRHGDDLADISNWPVIDPGAITTTRDGAVDIIRLSPTKSHPQRGFYVLEVLVN